MKVYKILYILMFVLIFNGCQNEIGDINFESGSLTNCKTDNSKESALDGSTAKYKKVSS